MYHVPCSTYRFVFGKSFFRFLLGGVRGDRSEELRERVGSGAEHMGTPQVFESVLCFMKAGVSVKCRCRPRASGWTGEL